MEALSFFQRFYFVGGTTTTASSLLLLFFFSLALMVWPTVCFVVVPGTSTSSSRHYFAAFSGLQTTTRLLQSIEFDNNHAQQHQRKQSLLDISLDLDPRWKEARIPFIEQHSNRVIDCHLAFCVDLDTDTDDGSSSITYGIGVPCDAAVALTLEEQQHDKITYLNPMEEEEIVQFFAEKLPEYLGPDIYLKITPKILTISGDLHKYTANWQETLFDNNVVVDRETLMDDSDEGLDYFYDFMKKELGDEEFQKTLDECKEDGGGVVDKDLFQLFTVPGLGQDQDNVESIIEEMLKSSYDVEDDDEELLFQPFTKIGTDLTHDGVALKLVGFSFPTTKNGESKSYALVQLLKPFTIVGKYMSNEENLQFELLTPEEEALIIPRLERICQKDLKDAGLLLSGP